MEWKGQIGTAQDVLDRIVALLLAIADLAERAARAPDARRRVVLGIIRSGEAPARDAFRASARATADRQVPPAGTVAFSGDAPEDALALATSLRALALIVRAIAALQRRLSSLLGGDCNTNGRREPRHFRSAFPYRLPAAAFPPAQRLDTS